MPELPDWDDLLTSAAHLQSIIPDAVLILKRNATRDYVDFAALADHMGTRLPVDALRSFDQLYPQESGQSALQQLLAQLSDARPFDLQKVSLLTYKGLAPKWQDWHAVKRVCADQAVAVFDQITSTQREDEPPSP